MMRKGSYGRWVLPAGSVLLALATVAGALGAHALAGRWSVRQQNIYDIAVRFQFYQSLGLLVMGALLGGAADHAMPVRRPTFYRVVTAPRTLLVGIALFCGSLYALSVGAPSWVGILTPFGGGLLILGWLLFAYDMWRS
jgi:uncharacterized membrane protein YgdD (TMEM256/DUF423 family)